MLIKMLCPRCEGIMRKEDEEDIFVCPYCDYKMTDYVHKTQVEQHIYVEHKYDQPKARSDGYTLIIEYTASNPNVKLVTRLVQTNQKEIVDPGQTRKYKLPPGKYVIVLKIGKINYNRAFTIPKSREPVTIRASWSGRASIYIEQPEVEMEEKTVPVQNSSQSSADSKPPKPGKNDMPKLPYLKRIFRKRNIPGWILTIASLVLIIFFKFGGGFFILAAIAFCPLITEVLVGLLGESGGRVLTIPSYIVGGILVFLGIGFGQAFNLRSRSFIPMN